MFLNFNTKLKCFPANYKNNRITVYAANFLTWTYASKYNLNEPKYNNCLSITNLFIFYRTNTLLRLT